MSPPVSETSAPDCSAITPRRSRLKFLNRSAWLLLLAGAVYYFYFCEGWRDVTVGRKHRKANDLFTEVEGITEVRIQLLATGPAKERAGEPDTVTLTGYDVGDFLGIWRYQHPSELMSAFCHEPAYRIQLYRGSRMVAETWMCWMCSNFSLEVWPSGETVLYGFDAKGKSGQRLLEFCDNLLPYWRELPSPAESPSHDGQNKQTE